MHFAEREGRGRTVAQIEFCSPLSSAFNIQSHLATQKLTHRSGSHLASLLTARLAAQFCFEKEPLLGQMLPSTPRDGFGDA